MGLRRQYAEVLELRLRVIAKRLLIVPRRAVPGKSEEHQMANVFKGPPDGRQSENIDAPVSRFRPTYRALTDEEKALHDEIKSKAAELEAVFEKVKGGRYKSLAMTDLERSVMWIVKELTS